MRVTGHGNSIAEVNELKQIYVNISLKATQMELLFVLTWYLYFTYVHNIM